MIINGDSKIELKKIADNSIDCIITDPPYGLGFMGKDWDKTLPDKEIFSECLRVLKAGGFACIMSAPRTDLYWRMCQMLEIVGFRVDFTPIIWAFATGFPKALNIGKLNKKFEGAYGGFQPKPAVEMIIVAMKPMTEKTFLAQAMENNKGISWLDDCRIPYGENEEPYEQKIRGKEFTTFKELNYGFKKDGVIGLNNEEGRFPANLLVSDNSIDTGKITKSEGGKTTRDTAHFNNSTFKMQGYGDEGDFSRYFDLDKWFEVQFIITPKASRTEKEKGLDEFNYKKGGSMNMDYTGHGNLRNKMYKNNHPTVKPIKLFSYLITMFTRKGDIVLDPFMGSGTTGCACAITDREFIGIELNKDYFNIAKARIDYYKKENENLFTGMKGGEKNAK